MSPQLFLRILVNLKSTVVYIVSVIPQWEEEEEDNVWFGFMESQPLLVI